MNLFSKKTRMCFFCHMHLTEDSTYTLQYKSLDGIHTETMCSECAKTFDKLADLRDKAHAARSNPI